MQFTRLMTGAAVVGLLALPVMAQTQGTTQQQQQPPAAAGAEQQQLAQQDLQFAEKAAQGGLMEVELGQLAQQQAESEDVQQFGERMVQDHSQANEQLMALAQQKGIELPQQLSEHGQQTYQELQQLSGAQFDQMYMQHMVQAHEEDIQAFEQEAQEGQDPDLQAFAQQTRPVLEEHLQLAQQIEQQVVAQTAQGQQQTTTQGTQEQAAAQPQGAIAPQEIIGREVVNANGEAIGEIQDIVLDQQQSPYAVLSVGGFLGIGDKEVAIPLDELQVGEEQIALMSQVTQQQLQDMPDYEENEYQPFAR